MKILSLIFSLIIPNCIALYFFVIEKLIDTQITIADKITSCSIFVIIILIIVALIFFNKLLNSKYKKYEKLAIMELNNDIKKTYIKKMQTYDSIKNIYHNILSISPFLIIWLLVVLIERKIISLRGILAIISISMVIGLIFNIMYNIKEIKKL